MKPQRAPREGDPWCALNHLVCYGSLRILWICVLLCVCLLNCVLCIILCALDCCVCSRSLCILNCLLRVLWLTMNSINFYACWISMYTALSPHPALLRGKWTTLNSCRPMQRCPHSALEAVSLLVLLSIHSWSARCRKGTIFFSWTTSFLALHFAKWTLDI